MNSQVNSIDPGSRTPGPGGGVSVRPDVHRAPPPLTTTPIRVARDRPDMIAIGAASSSGHGVATTSTATACGDPGLRVFPPVMRVSARSGSYSSIRDPMTRVRSRGSWKYSAASAVIRDVAMNRRLRQRLMPGVVPLTSSMRDRK